MAQALKSLGHKKSCTNPFKIKKRFKQIGLKILYYSVDPEGFEPSTPFMSHATNVSK
jgi:hypothetical protein